MDHFEQPLLGGNASVGVVLVDGTVRKPWTAATPSVQHFMSEMKRAGITVPLPSGPDAQGRQILEFIPGTPALDLPKLSDRDLLRVGREIRAIHDASEGISRSGTWEVLLPIENADLICHNDLTPWNLIIGQRWVFIDWDGAGPSTRLWDLAYSAQAFADLNLDRDPADAARRLRAFVVDGYRASDALCRDLPRTLAERTGAMYDHLARSAETDFQPWGRMFHEGHGDHWLAATQYLRTHETLWRKALSPNETPATTCDW